MSGAMDVVRSYIEENHLDGRAELEPDTPLLEWGVLDSLALADLLEFIEERFGVRVPTSEVTPEAFGTPASIGALVETLSGAVGSAR